LKGETHPERFYVGLTENLGDRLRRHNAGEVRQLAPNVYPCADKWRTPMAQPLPNLARKPRCVALGVDESLHWQPVLTRRLPRRTRRAGGPRVRRVRPR